MQTVTLQGEGRFSPEKIIGVGRNYRAHAHEMGSEVPAEPVLFVKPPTALWDMTQPLPIPTRYGAVHHEVELAVLIGAPASEVTPQEAMGKVAGYGAALDLTLRDVQSAAKKKGLPWAVAKGFDHSCPVSPFVPKEKVTNLQKLTLRLWVNDQLRQQGSTEQMIFPIAQLISYISRFFTLRAGDIILTGTPAGVGALLPGDRLRVKIDNIADITTSVKERKIRE